MPGTDARKLPQTLFSNSLSLFFKKRKIMEKVKKGCEKGKKGGGKGGEKVKKEER